MCVIVYHGDIRVDTIGGLRGLVHKIVFHMPEASYHPLPDNCCLCPVDFAATAEANGCGFLEDPVGDYELFLPGEHAGRS